MGDNQSIRVRLQRPEDDEAIVELLEAAFRRWPKIDAGVAPVDHLRWKKLCDPEGDDYNCVAETEGRIVGTQFFWIQDLKVGDGTLRSAQGVDFYVHPDYQGRGIRTGVKAFAYETVGLTTQFSLSVDGDHPAMVHMVETTNDQLFLLANKINVLQCDVPVVRTSASTGTVAVRLVSQFDEGIDALCMEASAPFQLIVMPELPELALRGPARRLVLHLCG